MASPTFAFDAKSARYRDERTGRFVADGLIRQAVDDVVAGGADRMKGLTRSLQSGQIDLPTWQRQMMVEIKHAHVATAMAARGGKSQMSPAAYGRAGAEVKRQYQYLRGFAQDIASGKQPLDGRAIARADMYGEAARQTFEMARRRLMGEKGHVLERRLLHTRESCSGCVVQAARGWQPEGTLAPVGSQECRTRCRCTFTFKPAVEAQQAA